MAAPIFLSDDWFAHLNAELANQARDAAPTNVSLVMSMRALNAPAGVNEVSTMSVSGGQLFWRAGESGKANVTIRADFDLLRASFLSTDPAMVLAEWADGKFEIEGDPDGWNAMMRLKDGWFPTNPNFRSRLHALTA